MKEIKVSILCLAYNHAKFIRQALDGFIMQKTNFPFEVIIHDDASTDGTADIIREYAKKYPDIIKPILQTENQWSRGVQIWKNYMWPNIRGKYVAVCDGDDYWIDEHKLQHQVDFLDAHPDYSICFHPVRLTWEDKREPDCVYFRVHQSTKTISDLLQSNFIPSCSVMYRWRPECIKLYPDGIFPGDWYVNLLHAQVGKIKYLPNVMSVYRRNSGGVWTGANESDDWFIKYYVPSINFYKCAMKQFKHDYTSEMATLLAGVICAFLRTKHIDKLSQLHDTYPEIWDAAASRLNTCDIDSIQKRGNRYKKLFNRTLCVCGAMIIVIYIIKGIIQW